MPSRFLHGDIGQLADHHSANVERGNTRAGSSPAVATINKRDVPRLLWKGRIEAKCTRLESVRGNTHEGSNPSPSAIERNADVAVTKEASGGRNCKGPLGQVAQDTHCASDSARE